jgi:hypothetical protein
MLVAVFAFASAGLALPLAQAVHVERRTARILALVLLVPAARCGVDCARVLEMP